MTCRISQIGMMGLEYTDLFWIMVLWDQNPVDSSEFRSYSTGLHRIPLEWPDSDRNRGGTVKYCKVSSFSSSNSLKRVRYPRSEDLRSGFKIFELQNSKIIDQKASTSSHCPFMPSKTFIYTERYTRMMKNWCHSQLSCLIFILHSQNYPSYNILLIEGAKIVQ